LGWVRKKRGEKIRSAAGDEWGVSDGKMGWGGRGLGGGIEV